jgi:hypothetical protein
MNIDISKVKITRHALKMAYQRFNIHQSYALKFFRSRLEKSIYLGECKDNSTHLFVYKHMGIVIDHNCNKIVTVMLINSTLRKKRKQLLTNAG